MKAVILAAGEGSRMRPLTYTRPKVMLPLANKPILEHLVSGFKKAGINEFIFVVGYHAEQVRNYFGNGEKCGVSIEYYQQRAQLGTADAIRTVRDLIKDKFLVANGDIIINPQDIIQLSHMPGNTMGLIEVQNPRGLGVVELNDGKVVRIYEKLEKPPTRLANAGLYSFTTEIFDAIAQTARSLRGEYEITDSLTINDK